jgi:hypothetical protein
MTDVSVTVIESNPSITVSDGDVTIDVIESSVLVNTDNSILQAVSFDAVAANILPAQTGTYTLGSSSRRWSDAHLSNVVFNDSTTQTTAMQSGASTSYTPLFQDGGTYSATQNSASGSYIKNGKLCYFNVFFNFTYVTNFGTTQYSITLPFTSSQEVVFRNGTYHDASANNTYHLTGHVNANSDVMTLFYTTSGQDQIFDHNSPVTIVTADSLHLSGMFETT